MNTGLVEISQTLLNQISGGEKKDCDSEKKDCANEEKNFFAPLSSKFEAPLDGVPPTPEMTTA